MVHIVFSSRKVNNDSVARFLDSSSLLSLGAKRHFTPGTIYALSVCYVRKIIKLNELSKMFVEHSPLVLFTATILHSFEVKSNLNINVSYLAPLFALAQTAKAFNNDRQQHNNNNIRDILEEFI